ncbi:roundabout homolog 1-like isoform X2 [Corticium candelabrum]|uniref:roundabout homolog 1-like isoform X2 n=1 Tax=Corticium candelabrum TaxID=121492 RepID=UPI002E25AD80|nr:roundabout homolog 1-like isoform X2 [Corticium candelabrum]
MERRKLSTAFICFIGALHYAISWDFESIPKNATVQVGEETLIACKAPANINPSYSYNKLKGALTDRAIRDAGGLHITNVQHSDEGWYECVVNSDEGSKSARAYLNVIDPLMFSTRPHNVTVSPGHKATLDCAVMTDSPVIYTWLKGGQPITSSAEITVNTGRLTVFSVQLSDVDIYTCKASTASGRIITADAAILITGLTAPRFSDIPNDTVIPKDASVTVQCAATGTPTPQIEWQHDGKTISGETSLAVLDGNPHITQAAVKASGVYTCIASNIKGSVSHSIKITVTPQETTTSNPTTDRRSSGEILGDRTLFIATVAASILLVLLIAAAIIVWWKCGRKKGHLSRRSSYSSRRRSSRRHRGRSRDFNDDFRFTHSSFMMGFSDNSYPSSMPLSEFDYNSRPVSFNFTTQSSKATNFRSHRKSSFSPSNYPNPGHPYPVSNPTFGLDDIESTLQRQMQELDEFETSTQSTPQSEASSRHSRNTHRVHLSTVGVTSTPKSDTTKAPTEAMRHRTLSQMMSGEPFEEPEEWGPEHEFVLNIQANIRMSRLWEVDSNLRALKMAQYDEESDEDIQE